MIMLPRFQDDLYSKQSHLKISEFFLKKQNSSFIWNIFLYSNFVVRIRTGQPVYMYVYTYASQSIAGRTKKISSPGYERFNDINVPCQNIEARNRVARIEIVHSSTVRPIDFAWNFNVDQRVGNSVSKNAFSPLSLAVGYFSKIRRIFTRPCDR